MAKIPVSFRCPEDLVKALDDEADTDHRDRSNLIVKIIAQHFNRKNGSKPATKKKAGTRQ